jgi:anti-sigma factor RsiW
MATTAFLPILSALDWLFVGHAQGPEPEAQPGVTHVAFGTLVDYVRGLGSAAAREQVREHLATCAHCEKTAGRLTRLTEIAAAEIDCEVPDDVVDEAIALFTADPSDRRALADVGELLSGPSTSGPYGVAHPARAQARPRFLRFAARGGEIDVQLLVIEERGGVSVSGQIFPRNGGGADWEVTAHRTAREEAVGRTRATTGGLFQLHYDAPAAVLLRFVNAGAAAPVDVRIDGDS